MILVPLERYLRISTFMISLELGFYFLPNPTQFDMLHHIGLWPELITSSGEEGAVKMACYLIT